DFIEAIFGSGLLIVGCCLLLTSLLLTFAYFAKPRQKEKIGWWDALIIGIAQAIAVLPGLSRSGSTIATGILLGNKKESVAKFSFLMVIIPILGEAFLDIKDYLLMPNPTDIAPISLISGFLAAFIVGCIACKWMINIVKRGKLIYFAVYCLLAAILSFFLI
ncbi:MAG TPA: undecaprenyl-diphosphate phosphatase, partial [Bacteroidales bacterium]|nr:undecaprenyl-diphosphate phosphatase [Bacteroidales bacterium]